MIYDDPDQELIIDESGPLARIVLNRPGVLNALSLEMIRLLHACFLRWREDDRIKAVFVTGAGKKAFCAGGDMKAVYSAGMAYRRGETSVDVPVVFFGEEYTLNRLMFNFPKPVVSFVNGIAMGGGFGIAGPSNFRVVCENTVFAMPEVGIGFFPDVGSAYYLHRCPGRLGTYLGLTGARIQAEDMIYAGLASHFVPFGQREACAERLARKLDGVRTTEDAERAIADVLNTSAELAPETGIFRKSEQAITECFSHSSLSDIMESLKQPRHGWAHDASNLLSGRSPTSLRVTFRHFQSSRDMTFDEVTAQDYMLAQHFIGGHDLYEGVRAVLLVKDNAPQWSPADVSEVTDGVMQAYFTPTGHTLEDLAA